MSVGTSKRTHCLRFQECTMSRSKNGWGQFLTPPQRQASTQLWICLSHVMFGLYATCHVLREHTGPKPL